MRTGEQGSWEGPLNTYPGFPPFNGGRDEEVDVAPSALGDVVPLFVKQKHKIKFNEPDCTIISKLIWGPSSCPKWAWAQPCDSSAALLRIDSCLYNCSQCCSNMLRKQLLAFWLLIVYMTFAGKGQNCIFWKMLHCLTWAIEVSQSILLVRLIKVDSCSDLWVVLKDHSMSVLCNSC